ncbi:MAG: hydrogenase maturation protease [Proteobacteria bacterium]|nr:hydrogenase maturation protease [Pseudomonadota bacterium]
MSPRLALLIIGYGNALRGDDGAGIRAATMIAARDSPIRVIVTHQLTPELAEDIARAAQVVFVDAYAAKEPGAKLRIERIGADDAHSVPGHHGDPARLLALVGRLGGSVPDAWVVGIPAFRFATGETISPETAQRIDEAVALFGE